MALRDMPVGDSRGFVRVLAHMKAKGRFLCAGPEVQIGWCVISGIDADHDELTHAAGVQIASELIKRSRLLAGWSAISGIDEPSGRIELGIDPMHQCVDFP